MYQILRKEESVHTKVNSPQIEYGLPMDPKDDILLPDWISEAKKWILHAKR